VPGGRSGVPLLSSVPELDELELPLELLLPESLPGSNGGFSVGKGLSVAAEEGVVLVPVVEPGASGVAAGFAGSPGNGNASAAGGVVSGDGAGQGLAAVWFGGRQGGGAGAGEGVGASGGLCAGVLWARQAVEKRKAARSARVVERIAICFRVPVRFFDGAGRRFVIVSKPGLLPCRYFI